MNAHYCFAAVPSLNPSPLITAHDKIPQSIKAAANFTQIPSWASLKSNPPSLQTQENNNKSQIESIHLISLSKQGKFKEAREFLKQMEDAVLMMYCNCGSLADASKVFDEMREKEFVFLEYNHSSLCRKWCF
ncbi:hypothetical protein OIU84_023807 [Salix udensis]|uniref:Pentatricopeptide repeat-containing protein n=1 Tax=Salix udensis TaxID=889485 RepID=A0AAD6KS49_9ROSI|nr:hypothetical protein OIU84_023807 [Salix udensis]